jgi:leader peptidase (prepilin peptidase)/N-methyltransferase
MAILYCYTAVIGLCIGSFLNVVIYRVPNRMSIVRPASHCPKCGKPLKKYDNIPVLSWVLLGGRCRFCGNKISVRYPAVELLNMLLWLLCLQCYAGRSLLFAFVAMAACSVLICVAFIDYDHMIIPDRFNLALLFLGAAAIFTNDGIRWLDRVIGCVGALLFFLLLFYGSIWILKREGLGGGDVKLMAAAGLLLGWKNVFAAIFIAALTACIIMIPLQKLNAEKQRALPENKENKPDDEDAQKSKEFPFGPFLTFGIAIALLFGTQLMNWYLGLFGL